MAPKKSVAVASSDSEGSVEVKPKAKRKIAKTKADTKSDAKKPAPKRAKTIVLTEPETADDGWTLHPPSLIYRFQTNPPGHCVCSTSRSPEITSLDLWQASYVLGIWTEKRVPRLLPSTW